MTENNAMAGSDPLYSTQVLELITVANEYCRFLEKADEYEPAEIMGFLQKVGPLIYLKSVLLPEVEVADEDAVEHYVTEEQWEAMFNVLHNKFGTRDEFYYVDLRERSHHDPVRGSLAECCTDTYQDLKDFLMLYQHPKRHFKENAVRECRRLFENRYGFSLVHAQEALHGIMYPAGDEITW